MDTTRLDLVFWASLACLLIITFGFHKYEQPSFELIHEINDNVYIVDFNLTEEDCINRLAPHTRNYCLKEL